MKFLLLALSLNLQILYPDLDTCETAAAEIESAGHVAICINSKKLIHAYGPKKKVLIMNIKDTIKIIEKTANLKVKKVTKI